MRVLFSGSREATQEMLRKAQSGVRWCLTNGHEVIVGDADGVDRTVITACDVLGVPVTVYGAHGRMRNKTVRYENIPLKCGYLARDREMAREAEIAFCIWNGSSRGTYKTYEFMRDLNKPAYLINFGGNDDNNL